MIPLDKIKTAQAMQDFIEEHMSEEITLHSLTKDIAYSPWHATRIFKEVVGLSPFEYIRKLRLSKAAVALWEEDKKIVDIAIDFVFDSHEGFTRAFTKQFGLTPSQYKKDTPMVPLFKPDPIRDHYRIIQGNDPIPKHEELSKTYFVQVLHFPKRKFIYKPCDIEANDYYTYASHVGCDVWGTLCSVKEALYEPIGVWFPEALKPQGCSCYVQGVEVSLSFHKEIPDGFDIMELPACDMMLFQGSSFDDECYEEAIGYINQEMEAYDPSLYGFVWKEEDGPRIQLEPQGYRGYMEVKPVAKITK